MRSDRRHRLCGDRGSRAVRFSVGGHSGFSAYFTDSFLSNVDKPIIIRESTA